MSFDGILSEALDFRSPTQKKKVYGNPATKDMTVIAP